MDKTLSYRSLTLFYRTEGEMNEGPPLVLIHGFAEDSGIWVSQMVYLKEKYQLIIPDLPGSGRSSGLPGEISMEEMANGIAAILDAEDIGQAILVGHSMGGYITLAFVEEYRDRVKAFGLFHSTAFPDSEEKKAMRRKSNEFIRKHGAAIFIQQSTPGLFTEDFREGHPDLIEETVSVYSDFDPNSLIQYYNAMIRRPDRTEILRQARQPVLFIIGEKDSTLPLETSLQQSHMPALSSIHILEKSGHMGMLEERLRSGLILEEFLNFVEQHSSFNHDQS